AGPRSTAPTSPRRSPTDSPRSKRAWTRRTDEEDVVSLTTTRAGAEAPATGAATRRSRGTAARRPLTGLLFVTPTAVIVAGLFLVPLAILVYMSFMDWPLLGTPTFDGLDNYRHLARDNQFVGAITFTLLYTAITTVVLFAVAFVLVAISNS